MKTPEYLDAVKRRLNVTSDYALKRPLGLSHQAVSKLRAGAVMSNTTALRVAALLDLEPLQVIADCELERGNAPEEWKRIKRAAALILMSLVPFIAQLLGVRDARAAFDTTPYCGSVSTAPSGGGIPVRHATGIHIAALRRRVVGFVRWCALAWLALSFCSL